MQLSILSWLVRMFVFFFFLWVLCFIICPFSCGVYVPKVNTLSYTLVSTRHIRGHNSQCILEPTWSATEIQFWLDERFWLCTRQIAWVLWNMDERYPGWLWSFLLYKWLWFHSIGEHEGTPEKCWAYSYS
jgi:hypothetical protein